MVNRIEIKFNKSKDLKTRSKLIPRLVMRLLIKKLKYRLMIKVKNKYRERKKEMIWTIEACVREVGGFVCQITNPKIEPKNIIGKIFLKITTI